MTNAVTRALARQREAEAQQTLLTVAFQSQPFLRVAAETHPSARVRAIATVLLARSIQATRPNPIRLPEGTDPEPAEAQAPEKEGPCHT